VRMRAPDALLSAFTTFGVLVGGPAAAREQVSVDVATGVAGSTNPFLELGRDTEAVSGFIEVSPLLTIEDEVSVVSVRGVARLSQYSNGYGLESSGSVNLDVTRRQTDRLTLRAGATLRSDRGNTRDVLTGSAILAEPVPGISQQVDDISFIGRRTRTTSVSARAGASYRLTDLDQLDADFGLGAYRFKDPRLSDYRYANQEVGYVRGLSARTSLRASLGLAEVDNLGRRTGDSLIVTPLVGVTQKLSETTRASLAVGPTFTRVRLPDGSHESSTGWAARGSFCADQARGDFCVNLDRGSEPTALGNVQTLTALRFVGDRRLSDRDTVQLTGNVSRTGGGGVGLRDNKRWFVGASGEYARQFTPRFSAFGRASFADIYDRGLSRRADLRSELGVRYRFGAIR
jgi:hypothetical protein